MGYMLRREIRALIPPGKLSQLERNIVLEIADQCDDDTRKTWPGSKLLQLLVDKNNRAIEEALARIADKWVELRVELGKGSDGRPYYSHRGKATTFCFPPDDDLRAAYEKATGIPWASSEHAQLPGAIRKPKQEKATKKPGVSDRKPPEISEEAPGFSGESPRKIRGPFPQGSSPQNFNTSNPSPLPPADTDARHLDRPGGRDGESEFDSEQEPRINTLTDVILNLRPDDRRWTVKSIRAAIARCLAAGKHLDDIERAFPVCAMDPNTKAPGRLPMDFHWWALPEVPGSGVQPASHTGPRCDTCWDSGLHTTDAGTTDCPDCTNDGNGNCRHHRGQYAHTCGGCRGDRLAEANRQGRPDWPAHQTPNNLPATRTDTTARQPQRESAQTRKFRHYEQIHEALDGRPVEEQLAMLAHAWEDNQ